MTHTGAPVPFVVYSSGAKGQGSRVKGFNEKEIRRSKLKIKDGYKLLGKFLADEL